MALPAYTTDDEIKYLQTLGKIGLPHTSSRITRVQLLESYIKNINRRANWGNVDPQKAYEAAVKMLEKERDV